ncbi:hypothetical protein SLA2020_024780 [Shorea laevis]
MGCSVLLWILFSSVNLCSASVVFFNCSPNSNITGGGSSVYQANLKRLSTQITSTKEGFNSGFYNLSVGQSPNQVNAIGLCIGDVNQGACISCLNDTISQLQEYCNNNTEAVGWSDPCMARYSSRDIFGAEETLPDYIIRSYQFVSNVNQFNVTLNSLLEDLTNRAATVGRNCLETARGKIQQSCYARTGCRILQPSCILKYEVEDGLSRPSRPPSSPPRPTQEKIIIIVVVSILGVLLLVLCIWIYLRLSKSREKEDENIDEIIKAESLQYDFATVRTATKDFCDENKLGQGGFGAVYKGELPSGQLVAVKRLSKGSGQGEKEFKNEVLLVAKLQHRNLVRLLGFCLEGKERLLIYEFVPNASLDRFIFDPIKKAQLDWQRRYRIIGGIARGLLYLHEDSQLRVIHRDLKPNNILLDGEMNPKISDFGLAKLVAANDQTHDTTRRAAGTYGYMAPEYIKHGHFSVKTDIFSFGIMILEILSGQKNSSPRHAEEGVSLIVLAWRNWRDGIPQNIIDPNLKEGPTAQIIRCIHIGLLCVQENVLQRPTIGSIVAMLTNNYINLPKPSHPAFLLYSRIQTSNLSSSPESHQSNSGQALTSVNDVSITELIPR